VPLAPRGTAADYRFFAVFLTAFFFAAFFAMSNPPFRSVDCASIQRRRALCRLARRAALLLVRVSGPVALGEGEVVRYKKRGARCEHPQGFLKNYRFFAAFFLAPLAAFFAIVFSSVVVDQPRRVT
jgi:hypothetical protein